MDNSIDAEIQKIRIEKRDNIAINLLVLFDQTSSIVENAIELELKHLHITQPQVKVLNMLSRENRPVTLDELANWTIKELNSVFALVNRMEKKGLVKKIRKDDDPKTYIALTEKGSILYHKKVTERSIGLIFGKLTDEEKKHFESTLKKIRGYGLQTAVPALSVLILLLATILPPFFRLLIYYR
jgi:DNA-binding MarR family transcriptional regulator